MDWRLASSLSQVAMLPVASLVVPSTLQLHLASTSPVPALASAGGLPMLDMSSSVLVWHLRYSGLFAPMSSGQKASTAWEQNCAASSLVHSTWCSQLDSTCLAR